MNGNSSHRGNMLSNLLRSPAMVQSHHSRTCPSSNDLRAFTSTTSRLDIPSGPFGLSAIGMDRVKRSDSTLCENNIGAAAHLWHSVLNGVNV